MTADLQSAVQRALSAWDTTTLKTNGDGMLAEAMEALRTEFDSAVMLNGLTEAETNETANVKGLTASPAEGDATLTEEQIDRFIPERIGVRNWGKPEQADLFNRGQVRDAIRTAIASQPNVQPKAAEVDAAPWSKTVESAALLLQRCTGLELQDCENLAGTILGMAANVQPKGTVSEFTNELGNAIRITIEGPTSTSENVLTPMEAAKLRGALNEHAAQAPAPAPEARPPVYAQLVASNVAALKTLLRNMLDQAQYDSGVEEMLDQIAEGVEEAMGDAYAEGRQDQLEQDKEDFAPQAPAVGADDEQDAAKYRHWRDHAEVLCAVLRYESPAWIDAYLAEALAERDASQPPVQSKEQP